MCIKSKPRLTSRPFQPITNSTLLSKQLICVIVAINLFYTYFIFFYMCIFYPNQN